MAEEMKKEKIKPEEKKIEKKKERIEEKKEEREKKREEKETAKEEKPKEEKTREKPQERKEFKKPRKIRWAIANIYSSKNNTVISVTDITGSETIAKSSGGMVIKQDRNKGKPYAAMQAAGNIVDVLKSKGINGLHIKIRAPGGHGPKSPGAGAQAVVRAIARMGIRVGKIEDVTPVPTDTTKRPGGRRGRRV